MTKTVKQKIKAHYYRSAAAITMGAIYGVSSNSASAVGGPSGDVDFSAVTREIMTSVGDVPGLVSTLSYLVGLVMAVLGVMKLKDHVENPGNTPLKEGAIRLATGGALFALPTVTDAVLGSIEVDGAQAAGQGQVNRVTVNGAFVNDG